MATLFRSLKNSRFALLWSGQSISALGDKIFQIALAWWILQKTGSAVAMGTVLILTTVPMLLFSLVGGAMVDRFPRLWLLFLSDGLRGVVVGAAALLALQDKLAIAHVYAFSLIFGIVDAFFLPAFRAAIPEISPADALTSSNSLNNLSRELIGIIGPSTGALIVSLGGTSLAFGLDSLSFFISCITLLPILGRISNHTPERTSPGMLRDIRAGIQAVLNSAWVWVTIAVAGISTLAWAAPVEVALPFLIKNRWHAGVSVLGLYSSIGAIGSIQASIWLGRLRSIRRRGMVMYGSWLAAAVLVMALGLPIGIPGILAASFGMGIGTTILGLVWVTLLQEKIPKNLLGRVSSVDYLGSTALVPFGYLIGGWGTEHFGPGLVCIIGGGVMTVLVSLGLLHPEIRKLD